MKEIDIPIFEMSQRQLKKKLAELKAEWERTSVYGSPWGERATCTELYELEHKMVEVNRLLGK